MKKRKYSKNKLLNNLLVVAACFLCLTMLFSFSDSFKDWFDSEDSVVEQENEEDIPNIDIPEGAHAFKIGNTWTYAYAEETWEEWLADSDRINLNCLQNSEGRIYVDSEVDVGGTYYLCIREGTSEEELYDSPVTISDSILFNVTYVFVIG